MVSFAGRHGPCPFTGHTPFPSDGSTERRNTDWGERERGDACVANSSSAADCIRLITVGDAADAADAGTARICGAGRAEVSSGTGHGGETG